MSNIQINYDNIRNSSGLDLHLCIGQIHKIHILFAPLHLLNVYELCGQEGLA